MTTPADTTTNRMTTSRVTAARGVTDLTEGVILASVDIATSPERAFRALTDPAELVKWWGIPGRCQAVEWTIDLRVGGRWEVRGDGIDGRRFGVEGEFLAIEAPTRLVLRWRPSWEPGLYMTISYRLEAVPLGTRVTLRHAGFASGSRRKESDPKQLDPPLERSGIL